MSDTAAAPSKLLAILGIGFVLGLVALALGKEHTNIDRLDAQQYLLAAYHLDEHGVFSQSHAADDATPGLGREPGMGAALALLRKVDPALDLTDPTCIATLEGCGREAYGGAIWLNRLFIALSGVACCLAAWLLSGRLAAAAVAGAHIWLNIEMQDGHDYIISDFLALFLTSLFTLAVVWAWRRSALAWILPGLVLAALILPKAVFFYFAILAIPIGLVCAGLFGGGRARALVAGWMALGLVAALPVGGWMARNASMGGAWSVAGDWRGGLSLSTRVVFNEMTPEQYLAAFVFWTRGFGDDLAEDLFEPEVWRSFRFEEPGGFNDLGQVQYAHIVRAMAAEQGLSWEEARNQYDAELMRRIMTDPVVHSLTTIPLFYRGVWIDEFILFSLPAFFWLLVVAVRRRQGLVFLSLSPALFSFVFHAALSSNLPRFQIVATPGLAIALGLAVSALLAWRQARRAGSSPG